MAHLCPDCNDVCKCGGDESTVVSLHMPADCEHCEEPTNYGDADEIEDLRVETMDARPGRRW